MLDPRGRQLLLESLRPPAGYRFDCAVGTTFSLDLMALLTTPLAFAMFDWQNDEGKLAADPRLPAADPLALLESLRRCADRIHVYCQAGQIKVPPTNQRLLAHLEQSVIEVASPSALANPWAVFHPKVWAVRYIGAEMSVRYRLLCLSRNLTFDTSWDTIVLLDGELTDRALGFGENRPLGEFIGSLPTLAARPGAVSERANDDTARIAAELRIVKWELPVGFDEVRFHPFGTTGKGAWPFPERIERLLVVAPFVTADFLKRIGGRPGQRTLVSRLDSLRALAPSDLIGNWQCFTIDDALDNNDDASKPSDLSGLHAKVFVVDNGWNAHVFTGSANATSAAFQGNVEFLIEMIGKKSRVGVDVALGDNNGSANLRSMLTEFTPGDEASQSDPDSKAAENHLESLRRYAVKLPLTLRIEPEGTGVATNLESATVAEVPFDGVVRFRPALLTTADFRKLENGRPVQLRFGPHAVESISSFVVCEISVRVGAAGLVSSFVLNLPLTGAPPDRRERLLRDLLKDSGTLLRFLLMLLSDDPERLFEEMRNAANADGENASQSAWNSLPLLEELLRVLHRSPGKIDEVGRLIDDLNKTPEGQALLPADLTAIWKPIAQARQEQRAGAS